jgi:hypothetical protein
LIIVGCGSVWSFSLLSLSSFKNSFINFLVVEKKERTLTTVFSVYFILEEYSSKILFEKFSEMMVKTLQIRGNWERCGFKRFAQLRGTSDSQKGGGGFISDPSVLPKFPQVQVLNWR